MTEELKIHIDDPDEIEDRLRAIGARYVKEVDITDTYFDQPGMVLKVTEDETGSLLTQLEAQDSGFRFIKEEPLDDVAATKEELAEQYGVKCVLKKRKRFWDYDNYNINLNLFDDIGNFLIVEGETVRPDIFTETLRIEDPQYLTRSFAELKLETDTS